MIGPEMKAAVCSDLCDEKGVTYVNAVARFAGVVVTLVFAASATAYGQSTSPPPRVAPDETDSAALTAKACREFAGLPIAAALRDPNPGQQGGPAFSVPDVDGSKAKRPGTNLRAIPKAAQTISLLCQNPDVNEKTIASLYLALTLQPPQEDRPGPPPPPSQRAVAPGQAALSRLQDAAALFIQKRVDNEIENNPHEKIYTTVDNSQLQWNAFTGLLDEVSAGQFATGRATDSKVVRELAQMYHTVLKQYEIRGVTMETQALVETQAAWLSYRDAWISYLAASHLDSSRNSFANFLDRERISQLSLLAN